MAYDLFGKQEMTEAILEFKPVGNFFLRTFFTNKPAKTHLQDTINIDIYKGARKVAAYSRASAKSTPLSRGDFTTKALELPYIKMNRTLEAAVAMLRRPGEGIFDVKSPAERAREQVALDLFELEEAIVRAEELQAAQAMIYAKVTIFGFEIDAEIDFGRDGDLEFTADELWTGSDVDISQQLRTWSRLVYAKSGYTPNTIVAGSEALDQFFANDRMAARLDNRNFRSGSIDTTKNVSPFPGARHYGNLDGFDVWEYFEQYIDPADGVEKELMPTDSILLCAPNARTVAHYGVIKDFDAGLAPLRRFAKSVKLDDPSALVAIVQTAPAMINHTPDATALIKVV